MVPFTAGAMKMPSSSSAEAERCAEGMGEAMWMTWVTSFRAESYAPGTVMSGTDTKSRRDEETPSDVMACTDRIDDFALAISRTARRMGYVVCWRAKRSVANPICPVAPVMRSRSFREVVVEAIVGQYVTVEEHRNNNHGCDIMYICMRSLGWRGRAYNIELVV